MNKFPMIIMATLSLSGCFIKNVDSGKAYNGLDSSYRSTLSEEQAVLCIQNAWRNIEGNGFDKQTVNVDRKDKTTVYTSNYLELAEVEQTAIGSNIDFYHNGDHLWGSKTKFINAIKRCL